MPKKNLNKSNGLLLGLTLIIIFFVVPAIELIRIGNWGAVFIEICYTILGLFLGWYWGKENTERSLLKEFMEWGTIRKWEAFKKSSN